MHSATAQVLVSLNNKSPESAIGGNTERSEKKDQTHASLPLNFPAKR